VPALRVADPGGRAGLPQLRHRRPARGPPVRSRRPRLRPAAGGLATSTNGLAIASLVLGILWLYWVGSILALVFGYIARRQIAQRQGIQGGRGLATAGIVLGWVGVGFLALFIVLAMVGLATDPTYDA
jgi:Domain of unknown function (DUF4190)